MSYVPKNISIFVAAYAGAIAGMSVAGRVLIDDNVAHYARISGVAGAFAQSFDTEWGLRPTTELDVSIVEEECEGTWEARYPSGPNPSFTNPATYTQQCRALIALITASAAYFTAQAIVPPPVPGVGNSAVIFDDAVPATKSTIRSARLLQSPVDNTKPGITNLGSDTTSSTLGAGGDFATISGGDQNIATGNYSTIGGGKNNAAYLCDNATISGGADNICDAPNTTVLGGKGGFAFMSGQVCHADGTFAVQGDAQHTVGKVDKGISVNAVPVALTDDDGSSGFVTGTVGRAFIVKVTCCARSMDEFNNTAAFIYKLLVHHDPGTASAVIDKVLADSDNAQLLNGTSWALAFTTIGNSVVATFTGSADQTVRAVANWEWVQVG